MVWASVSEWWAFPAPGRCLESESLTAVARWVLFPVLVREREFPAVREEPYLLAAAAVPSPDTRFDPNSKPAASGLLRVLSASRVPLGMVPDSQGQCDFVVAQNDK